MTRLYDLPDSLKDDALTLLGSGVSRQTYVYTPNEKTTVIKLEVSEGWHQNTKEWHVWNAVKRLEGKYKDLKDWFAPCVRISDLGRWLLMGRTYPVSLHELRKELPKVPDVLTDLKVGNWGRLPSGRIVCHDYGTCLAIEHGLYNYRLRPAKWWEGEG